MSRPRALIAPLFLGTSLLFQMQLPDAAACKPCPEPSLSRFLSKADVVAVAEVTKVDVKPRAPDAQSPRDLRDVRWQVKVARSLKGNLPRQLIVEHADAPPCITAIVPQPGRYLMLLYRRDGRYSPLSYCDQALFEIDAQDRVTVPSEMMSELQLTSAQVPLKTVAELLARLTIPPPT